MIQINLNHLDPLPAQALSEVGPELLGRINFAVSRCLELVDSIKITCNQCGQRASTRSRRSSMFAAAPAIEVIDKAIQSRNPPNAPARRDKPEPNSIIILWLDRLHQI
ncbi:MAG: hypothetical protein R3F40_07615 [Candidatus Competibacteraceae bacterium]